MAHCPTAGSSPFLYKRCHNDTVSSCHIQSPTTFPFFLPQSQVWDVSSLCGFQEVKSAPGWVKTQLGAWFSAEGDRLLISLVPLTSALNLKKKDFIYLFLERGEGKEKERETLMCACLSHAPCWGPGPQPRHVPWLGNQTGHPLVCRPVLNPLSHTSQGWIFNLCEESCDCHPARPLWTMPTTI